MAFNINATMDDLLSSVKASGYVTTAEKGEPKQPPTSDVHAGIYMQDARVVELTLATTIELHIVTIRLYKNAFEEPGERTETKMAEVASNLMADILGDFDLDATIRNVDAGGQYGTVLGAVWGYVGIGTAQGSQVMFRTVDITVPMIIDGSATPAQ